MRWGVAATSRTPQIDNPHTSPSGPGALPAGVPPIMRSMVILAHAGFSAASVMRQAVIAQDRQHVGGQQCVDEPHDDHALRMLIAGEYREISRRAPGRCKFMLLYYVMKELYIDLYTYHRRSLLYT